MKFKVVFYMLLGKIVSLGVLPGLMIFFRKELIMSTNDILGAIVLLLGRMCPDFLGAIRDFLEKLCGESGQTWFAEFKRFLCKKPCWLPNILRLDRSVKFDPTKFQGLGEGWEIEEEDENSLALTEIDLTRVRLEHMLREGEETWIKGEDKLKRLKKVKRVRLDARVFQALWEDQSKIPESWKELTNGEITYIYFDGTVLRNPSRSRYVLCLYWFDGRWSWTVRWLESVWGQHCPSAVLVK